MLFLFSWLVVVVVLFRQNLPIGTVMVIRICAQYIGAMYPATLCTPLALDWPTIGEQITLRDFVFEDEIVSF